MRLGSLRKTLDNYFEGDSGWGLSLVVLEGGKLESRVYGESELPGKSKG